MTLNRYNDASNGIMKSDIYNFTVNDLVSLGMARITHLIWRNLMLLTDCLSTLCLLRIFNVPYIYCLRIF